MPSLRTTVRAAFEDIAVAHQVPGLVVAAARLRGRPHVVAVGRDGDNARDLQPDDLFPVASITKLAVALAIHRLISIGVLSLEAPAANFVPGAGSNDVGVTIGRLLSHTSGLPTQRPADMPQLMPGRTWLRRVRHLLALPLERPPGQYFAYSNFGYLLLGAVIEQVTGDFHTAIRCLVLRPLGVEGYIGEKLPREPVRLVGAPFADEFNDPGMRDLGLPSGGLFTTAAGALELGRAFARVTPIGLPAPALLAAREVQTIGANLPHDWSIFDPRPPWGLGVELRGTPAEKHGHWTPDNVGPDSFGHYGASGGLVWCDPHANVAWAILSSRTSVPGLWPIQGRARMGRAVLEAMG